MLNTEDFSLNFGQCYFKQFLNLYVCDICFAIMAPAFCFALFTDTMIHCVKIIVLLIHCVAQVCVTLGYIVLQVLCGNELY